MSAPNDNPPPPSDAGQQVREEVEDRLMRSVQARYAENAEVTLEKVTEIIGDEDPVANEDWDQTAEDRIEALWEASKRKTSSDKLGTRGNNDDPLCELWRLCLRFMKQAPPIMLSPINGLQFTGERQSATSGDLFSKPACQAMSKLLAIRSRSRSHLRSPSLHESDREFRPLPQRQSSYPADFSSRQSSVADEEGSSHGGDTGSPAAETHEDNGYYPDDDGYMPEDNEFAGHVEAEESSQMNPALPSPRQATDFRPPLSQALAKDEIAQVHREVDELSNRIRDGAIERDRLIEKVKTDQAETHRVFKKRHVDAVGELKENYEMRLQASRSENAKTIAALKSEHANAIAALKAEFNEAIASLKSGLDDGLQAIRSEQSSLIKTLQEENERLRQSTQGPAQRPEPAPTPVEVSAQPDDSSQQTESLASVMARMPEGMQLPRVQARYTITVTPPFAGSITGRNDNIPSEPGWRDDVR
ncbi:hypothetical protein FPRO04_07513 [Fusarium proliferatum]|nr:hypothetical protein FPRO04_07513 [Fusarium proliferatum]